MSRHLRTKSGISGIVIAMLAAIVFLASGGASTAQQCAGGYYINDVAPDCLWGCQSGCGCAICPPIIVD